MAHRHHTPESRRRLAACFRQIADDIQHLKRSNWEERSVYFARCAEELEVSAQPRS